MFLEDQAGSNQHQADSFVSVSQGFIRRQQEEEEEHPRL